MALYAEVRDDLEDLRVEACRKAASRSRKADRWRFVYYVSAVSIAITTFLGAGSLLIDSGTNNTRAALIVLLIGGISTAMSAVDPWARMVANFKSEATWMRHARDIKAAKRKQTAKELEVEYKRLREITESLHRNDVEARGQGPVDAAS